MARIKYREALRDALMEEMERDESVFCIGEGIGERGGSYKVTEGLFAKFGAGRVIDTPLSEAGFVGVGVGAAIAGQRPVVEMLFIDFLMLAMDQVVNQAAKYRFMSGGEGRVPLVVRTQGGAGNSLAGQHSQSLEALFYHVPGLKVVMPSTPRDAKGLLISAIRDDDPVIFIEHKLLYLTDGDVPDEPYVIPLGQAEVKRPGTDVTLVTWSHMTLKSLQAAEALAGRESRPRSSISGPSSRWTSTPSSSPSAGPATSSSPRRPSSVAAWAATSRRSSPSAPSRASERRSSGSPAGTPSSRST